LDHLQTSSKEQFMSNLKNQPESYWKEKLTPVSYVERVTVRSRYKSSLD